MTSRYLGLAACAGLLVSTHAALAQSPFYISGSAGAELRSDVSAPTTFSNSVGRMFPGTDRRSYDAGPVVDLGVGYRLPLGFRIEGEIGYAHYMTDSASPFARGSALNGSRLSLSSGGGHDLFTATANVFYDLPLPGPVTPYIGTGFGYYHGVSTDAGFNNALGQRILTSRSGTSDNALVLAEVGVTLKLDDHWSISPAYRFEHLFVASGEGADMHVFKLGARYSF